MRGGSKLTPLNQRVVSTARLRLDTQRPKNTIAN
jgi:hypothetical protein